MLILMEQPKNISMSIMLDNRNNTTEMSIPKITPAIWIPSNKINRCYNCKGEFGLWLRKHHCRVCGRIFCSQCSNNWGRIPSLVNITSSPKKSFSLYPIISQDKRMCAECKKKTDFINKSSRYIYIFSNVPITIKDLYNLRLVCKQWCKTIGTILSIYKSTQYYLPLQKFSKLEKQFYYTHCFEFSQHFNLMSKCIVCLDNKTNHLLLENIIKQYSQKNKIFCCRELACKRNCTEKPKIEEILELCYTNFFLHNKNCRLWVINEFSTLEEKELILLMPWLLKICTENVKIASEMIIPLCIRTPQLIYSFYFECRFYMLDSIYNQKLNNIFELFLKKIGEKNINELKKTVKFISLVNCNIKFKLKNTKWGESLHSFFDKFKYAILPWNTNLKCIGIVPEGIINYNSATHPWKVPLLVKNEKNEEKIINILIKNEDIRKDKLTMIIAFMIQKVCGDLVDIALYDVFPINNHCGWIEMVEEANTLYDIKHKYETTIQNYIMDLNPDATVKELRNRFIQTCVSSCVLCYVLGVGDRHLENILVTKNGKLLHIDFSYILGDDPKQFEVEMKITSDMLNMLGGKSSSSFKKFKNNCKEAYKRLRQRSSLWYILLTYLVFTVPTIDNFKYTSEKITTHVIERLVPGENDKEASMQIIDILERSSNSKWNNNITEISHFMGNELRRMAYNMPLFNLEI